MNYEYKIHFVNRWQAEPAGCQVSLLAIVVAKRADGLLRLRFPSGLAVLRAER
jgi:hypothetical protein